MTATQPRFDYSTIKAPRHGRLAADVWRKSVRRSAHMLRRPPAWAVDLADLDAAEAAGARLLWLRDTEQGQHWWASIATIRARGFRLSRGHGAQLALPLHWWRATRTEAEALAAGAAAGAPVQLGLLAQAVR